MLSTITDFLDKLEPVDVIRAASLIVCFVGVVFIDRRRNAWFQFETAALALGGFMWILAPRVVIGIQVSRSRVFNVSQKFVRAKVYNLVVSSLGAQHVCEEFPFTTTIKCLIRD